jgi:hypothetical protein
VGFRTIRTSDLSGQVLHDGEVVNVVVRVAPGLTEAKQFDCSAAEIDQLVAINDLVRLEVRGSDGKVAEVACTAEEFAKVVDAKTLAGLSGVRGRRPGQRAGNGGK